MVSIILITIFQFNLGGFVAIIMRLILRKSKQPNKIRNVWYVPAIVAFAVPVLSLSGYLTFSSFVGVLLNAVYYLIFGYWFIKYLK